jgi:hypothetical protein
MKNFIILIIFLLSSAPLFPQDDDIRIGTNLGNIRQQTQGALFDYSDPESINIKVLVWGFVKYPGQYIIPSYSSVNDLLSLAGGPLEAARIEDLRILRVDKDSVQTLIKFDYNDLLWNDDLTAQLNVPNIQAGDILLVPGEPRYYFKDYFSLTLSVVSTLVSIATLIFTLTR